MEVMGVEVATTQEITDLKAECERMKDYFRGKMRELYHSQKEEMKRTKASKANEIKPLVKEKKEQTTILLARRDELLTEADATYKSDVALLKKAKYESRKKLHEDATAGMYDISRKFNEATDPLRASYDKAIVSLEAMQELATTKLHDEFSNEAKAYQTKLAKLTSNPIKVDL